MMAKGSKKGNSNQKLVAALTTTGAVFLVRKLITIAWTRATGKTPPTDPADPKVGLLEALGWAIVAGASIEATRLFAARATSRQARAAAAAAADSDSAEA
jgi:hypothetical protein